MQNQKKEIRNLSACEVLGDNISGNRKTLNLLISSYLNNEAHEKEAKDNEDISILFQWMNVLFDELEEGKRQDKSISNNTNITQSTPESLKTNRTYKSRYDYSEVIELFQFDNPKGFANDLMVVHDSAIIMMEEIIMNDDIEIKTNKIVPGISGGLWYIKEISKALIAAEDSKN
jgi:hypothetical protein